MSLNTTAETITAAIQKSGTGFSYTSSGKGSDGDTYIEMRRGTDKLYIRVAGVSMFDTTLTAYMNDVKIGADKIDSIISAIPENHMIVKTDTTPAATPEEMRIYFLQKQIDALTSQRNTLIADALVSETATISALTRVLNVTRVTIRRWGNK